MNPYQNEGWKYLDIKPSYIYCSFLTHIPIVIKLIVNHQ